MKRTKRFLALAVVMLLISCATFQTLSPANKAVTSYEIAGASLTQAYNTAQDLKAKGKLAGDNLAAFNREYRIAYDAYKGVGDAMIAWIKASDNTAGLTPEKAAAVLANKKSLLDKFTVLAAALPTLVNDAVRIVSEVK